MAGQKAGSKRAVDQLAGWPEIKQGPGARGDVPRLPAFFVPVEVVGQKDARSARSADPTLTRGTGDADSGACP